MSCLAASVIMVAACTSQAPAADHGASVNPSSLYQGPAPSAGTKPSSAAAPDTKSASHNDASIPPGQSGELVPDLVGILASMTPQQDQVVNTATYLELKKCMGDQGFRLLDPPPKLEVPKYGPVLYDAWIGILDKGYAAKYGYQLYLPLLEATENQDPQQIKPNDAKYMQALSGTDGEGGCDAQADRMLQKNVHLPNDTKAEEDRKPLGRTYDNSVQATFADPKYKKVLRQWSQCMAKAGFDYQTPKAAFGAYKGFQVTPQTAFSNKPPHPSKLEVNTAVTDAECKQSSGLPDVYKTVFWSYQQADVAKNRPALKPFQQANAQELRNAQKMIKDLS